MTTDRSHPAEGDIQRAVRSTAGLAIHLMSREQQSRRSQVSRLPLRRTSSGRVSTSMRKVGCRVQTLRVSWSRFPVDIFDSIQSLKDGGPSDSRNRSEGADGAENELKIGACRFSGDCYGIACQESGQDPYDAEKLVHLDWQDAKESVLGDSAELTNSVSRGMRRHQMGR